MEMCRWEMRIEDQDWDKGVLFETAMEELDLMVHQVR